MSSFLKVPLHLDTFTQRVDCVGQRFLYWGVGAPQPGKPYLCPLKGQLDGKGSDVIAMIAPLPESKGLFSYSSLAVLAFQKTLPQGFSSLQKA